MSFINLLDLYKTRDPLIFFDLKKKKSKSTRQQDNHEATLLSIRINLY